MPSHHEDWYVASVGYLHEWEKKQTTNTALQNQMVQLYQELHHIWYPRVPLTSVNTKTAHHCLWPWGSSLKQCPIAWRHLNFCNLSLVSWHELVDSYFCQKIQQIFHVDCCSLIFHIIHVRTYLYQPYIHTYIYMYIYGKCLGFARNRNHDRQRIIIIIIIIKPLLKIFNECRSLTGVGELNPYWRSSMNVEV